MIRKQGIRVNPLKIPDLKGSLEEKLLGRKSPLHHNRAMTEEKLKAIVLRAVPFKDRQSILTLISEEKGLISMIVKGLSKKNPHLIASINPLCEAEFVFIEGRTELLRCKEASVIDTHLSLREKYSYLELGMRFAKVLLDTQYPGKPSPSLYALFSSFLKQISAFDAALPALSCSFLLKVLKHEGLLMLDTECSVCSEDHGMYLWGRDFYCKRHKPKGSLPFAHDEWQRVACLAHASSFQTVKQIPADKRFQEKIETYFQERIKQM